MFVRKLAVSLVLLFGLLTGIANAQPEARVRAVVPSVEAFENDLKWLIELSPDASLHKQWKTLKEDILDAFTQGVDLTKPISVDVVFRKDEIAYEFRIPIESLGGNNGFLAGLKGMGFKVVEVKKGTHYTFAEKKDQAPFYLRYDKNYAWISKAKIPEPPPSPVQDLQPLLAVEKDIVASLRNDAAGLKERRESFKNLRKQFEALVKLRRNEDPSAYELRKLVLKNQLDEGEKFLVEAEELLVTWNTVAMSPGVARGEISLTSLPGTDLQKSIEMLNAQPSDFANVTLHDNPIAQIRVNFAVDPQRIENIRKFYKTLRPIFESEIPKLAGLDEAEKTATKQAANKFLDMMRDGLDNGAIDLFADGFAVEKDKNVMVCGVKAADGTVADEIVKLLPSFEGEWKVKLAAEKHGGVTIHEITVPKTLQPAFQKIFAGETVFYVGTSKTAVWGAAGSDCLKYLQSAIDQSTEKASDKVDPVFVSYQFKLDQIVNLLELAQQVAPKKAAPPAAKDKEQQAREKEERQRQKDLEKYRKLAQDAMGDCTALLQGELKRTGNKVEGYLELNECVLKFVGSMIADGVKVLQ